MVLRHDMHSGERDHIFEMRLLLSPRTARSTPSSVTDLFLTFYESRREYRRTCKLLKCWDCQLIKIFGNVILRTAIVTGGS